MCECLYERERETSHYVTDKEGSVLKSYYAFCYSFSVVCRLMMRLTLIQSSVHLSHLHGKRILTQALRLAGNQAGKSANMESELTFLSSRSHFCRARVVGDQKPKKSRLPA